MPTADSYLLFARPRSPDRVINLGCRAVPTRPRPLFDRCSEGVTSLGIPALICAGAEGIAPLPALQRLPIPLPSILPSFSKLPRVLSDWTVDPVCPPSSVAFLGPPSSPPPHLADRGVARWREITVPFA